MATHLAQEIDKLHLEIINMFALTEQIMEKTVKALIERNQDLAEEAIEEDDGINAMEVKIDGMCLRLLALDQPVARDLRFILSCSRICIDLERIGDQATNIAERAIMLSNRPPLPFGEALEELASKTMEMYKKTVNAFVNRDSDAAIKVCEMDAGVDKMYVKLIKRLIDYLAGENVMVERTVHTIMISKFFERVADLATNIAESVVFVDKGVDIRHSNLMDKLRLTGNL